MKLALALIAFLLVPTVASTQGELFTPRPNAQPAVCTIASLGVSCAPVTSTRDGLLAWIENGDATDNDGNCKTGPASDDRILCGYNHDLGIWQPLQTSGGGGGGGGDSPPFCTVAELASLTGQCSTLGSLTGSDFVYVTNSTGRDGNACVESDSPGVTVGCVYDQFRQRWVPQWGENQASRVVKLNEPNPSDPGETSGIQAALDACQGSPNNMCEIQMGPGNFAIAKSCSEWQRSNGAGGLVAGTLAQSGGAIVIDGDTSIHMKGAGMNATVVSWETDFSDSACGIAAHEGSTTASVFRIEGNAEANTARWLTFTDFQILIRQTNLSQTDPDALVGVMAMDVGAWGVGIVRDLTLSRMHLHVMQDSLVSNLDSANGVAMWLGCGTSSCAPTARTVYITQSRIHSSDIGLFMNTGDDVKVSDSWFGNMDMAGYGCGRDLLEKKDGTYASWGNTYELDTRENGASNCVAGTTPAETRQLRWVNLDGRGARDSAGHGASFNGDTFIVRSEETADHVLEGFYITGYNGVVINGSKFLCTGDMVESLTAGDGVIEACEMSVIEVDRRNDAFGGGAIPIVGVSNSGGNVSASVFWNWRDMGGATTRHCPFAIEDPTPSSPGGPSAPNDNQDWLFQGNTIRCVDASGETDPNCDATCGVVSTDYVAKNWFANNVIVGSNTLCMAGTGSGAACQLAARKDLGGITVGPKGLGFFDSDSGPTCNAGDYYIWADTSELKLKKCENGTTTDLDTGGGGGGDTALNDILDATGAGTVAVANFAQTWEWNTPGLTTAVDFMTLAVTRDATVDATNQNLLTLAQADDGNGAVGALESLLHLTNLDTNDLVTTALRISSAAGGITTAIDASDSDIGTALALGDNETTVGGVTLSAAEIAILDNGISGGNAGDITDNSVDVNDLAASLGFADGDLVSFAGVTPNTTTEGLILPQATVCTSATAEGQVCWDSDNHVLHVGTGGATETWGGGGSFTGVSFSDGTNSQTLADGQTLTFVAACGTGGIDCTVSATDQITFAFDASEVNAVTWLDGNARQWAFNSGSSPHPTLDFLDAAMVWNEGGNDIDHRFEGDADPNLLMLDASSSRVGVGIASPTARLDVDGRADEEQLRVQAHSTQTSQILVIEDSSGNDIFSVSLVAGVATVQIGSSTIPAVVRTQPPASGGGTMEIPESASGGEAFRFLGVDSLAANRDCQMIDSTRFIEASCIELLTAADLATDAVSADELNATGVEAELEAALDLPDIAGTLTRAKGGTGADTSAFGVGLLGSDGANATIDVDTIGELETAIGGTNLTDSTELTAATLWTAIGDASANGAIAMAGTVQTMDWDTPTSASAADYFSFRLTKDATIDGATQELVSIVLQDFSGDQTGVLETLLHLESLEAVDPVTVALRVSAAAGLITTAIDVSDAEIGTALAIGDNDITTSGETISETEFDDLDNGINVSELAGAGSNVLTALAANTGAVGGLPRVIAQNTEALTTTLIASGACDTSDDDISATGVASTDTIDWSFNADISGVTGYAPVTTGGLIVYAWPGTDEVNFKVCNPTSSSITPGAVTVNWRVIR